MSTASLQRVGLALVLLGGFASRGASGATVGYGSMALALVASPWSSAHG
ncbi:hypothetical protein MBEHAL_2412 [Halarchaeum acidiphilum MH1-52-1]|uniref:Uncharacterized protein n=1 Tax=Halarchaeum acidiphilum MH1-52-1 TaxID=1261545 RepID=U2YXW2_9EURY|nr:hypothetical protein [Halarchaeum acidiphilum]GAD53652.1 hypothetical protein MBEHAL_2412 [Halarchaeum acidiphilum MH1-52-1]